MKFAFAILVSVLILAVGDAYGSPSPRAVVQSFYRTKIALGAGGMPSRSELADVTQYLSPDLVALLGEAREIELACAKVTPANIKPPLWEGSVFSGNTEGATRLVRTRQHASRGKSTVSMDFEHIDANFPVGHQYRVGSWTVDAKLIRSGQSWLISDLIYEDGKSLRVLLLGYRTLKCAA